MLALSTSVGVAVGEESLRAVAVRRGAVRWAIRLERSAEDSVEQSVIALLAPLGFPRWPRTRVRVALGASLAQFKQVPGLPSGVDPRLLAGILAEGQARFFLRNGSALVTSSICLAPDRGIWATAVDSGVVAALRESCEFLHLRLEGIMASASVLGCAFSDGEVGWVDGSVLSLVHLEHHQPTRHGCRCATPSVTSSNGEQRNGDVVDAPSYGGALRADSPLRFLAPEGWRYADAFGAAVARMDDVPAIRVDRATTGRRRLSRWRVLSAAGAFLVAAAAAFLTPSLAAVRTGHAARARLRALGDAPVTATAALREVNKMTAALGDVRAFLNERHSALTLLAHLTSALSDSTTVVALHVDSVGGTAVILCAHTADALRALEDVRDIDAPQIMGPVTREVLNTRTVERFAVRFQLRQGNSRTPHDTVTGS